MILYNVTINIDDSVHDEWLQWMKEKHIPDVLDTGLFFDNKVCKIHAESDGGVSYSIQYLAKTWDDYNRYEKEFAPKLQQEHLQKYNGKFGAFRTMLEIVHHEERK
jgi:hypothetical protein